MAGLRAPAPHAGFSERIVGMLGVDPMETLEKLRAAQGYTEKLRQAESRLVAELASYEARYGYPSHWEHERKSKLSMLSTAYRHEAQARGVKTTEAEINEYAHSHPDYRDLLREAKQEREKMENLKAQVVDIRGKLETAKGVEVYYERLARTTESVAYAAGKEAGMTR